MALDYYLVPDQIAPPSSLQAYILNPSSPSVLPCNHWGGKGRNILPVLPINRLTEVCLKTKKIPLLDIFSVDYSIDQNGHLQDTLLSEADALQRAKNHHAVLYQDDISKSGYFCYLQPENQHMVWVETSTILLQKIRMLEQQGVSRLAFRYTVYNAKTLNVLLQSLISQETRGVLF